jgi:hypothetical protein
MVAKVYSLPFFISTVDGVQDRLSIDSSSSGENDLQGLSIAGVLLISPSQELLLMLVQEYRTWRNNIDLLRG